MTRTLPYDAVIFDIGGTLVAEAPSGTAVADLSVVHLDGSPRTLAALRDAGLRLGAVTDTSVMTELDVRSLLADGGLDALLEVLVTSVDVGAAKPDPTGLRIVLERLGVTDPARALFVGDRDVDRGAAEAAGCGFAAVGAMGDGVPLHESLRRAFVAAGARPADAAAVLVAPVDADAAGAADRRQLSLTKPPGSLGFVEELGARLAAIAGTERPPVPDDVALAVFAGDHGVLDRGVSPWPREVTAQMIANVAGGGAAVSVLARQLGVDVTVVDVGVATPWPTDAPVLDRNIAKGTADISIGPAMTEEEVRAALDVGAQLAADLVSGGAGALATGDMGIGNTTPSAALVSLLTGIGAVEVTGRGTGIDDPTLSLKVEVVSTAVARARSGAAGEIGGADALREVGGFEHAAIAGFIIGGAAARVPVLVDGVIALSALLAAARIAPDVVDHAVAGHRSVEPGATAALEHLGLRPVLDLDLRLGEGSGAVLAVPVVRAAAAILSEMATFDEAGVTDKG